MSETTHRSSPEMTADRLTVSDIAGDTLSLFFRRFIQFFLLALIPTICTNIIIQWTVSPLLFSSGTRLLAVGLTNVAGMIGAGIAAALVLQYAIDAMAGRPMRPGKHFSAIVAVLFPLVCCSVITGGAVILSAFVFLGPGLISGNWIILMISAVPALAAALFVATLWSCVIPVIVLERVGFSALARSPALTKGFRRTVFMTVTIFVFASAVFQQAIGYLTTLVINPDTMSIAEINLIHNVSGTVTAGIVAGVLGAFTAVLFVRLRDVKEGVPVTDPITGLE